MLSEVLDRFGHGTLQRRAVTDRLMRIYDLAVSTGKLRRFIISGSYITVKSEPNDVDIVEKTVVCKWSCDNQFD